MREVMITMPQTVSIRIQSVSTVAEMCIRLAARRTARHTPVRPSELAGAIELS